ncbi:MAG: DNA topoisomerase I [Candidatus Thermoplasmatota archaeon]
MKLVICEKNIAARRIAYILSGGNSKRKRIGRAPVYHFTKDGETWKVVGLRGHILNLDYPKKYNRWKKTDPKELINIEPRKKVSNKAIANALKNISDKNPFIIVATDYDREGELIGVEVVDMIRDYNENIEEISRAKFSSITGGEIKKAFAKLADVDYNLSAAGESRQIIDLVWGAVLTRFISLAASRFGKNFLSIGRVQSPTLSILVEREREIENFEPTPFWKLLAVLNKGKIFSAKHIHGRFWEREEPKKILNRVEDCEKTRVKKLDKKMVNERPPSPFNTTSFLRAASYMGVSSSKAMQTAEKLYMSGFISYPRTDNTVYPYSLNIKGILKKLSKSKFSKEVEIVENNRRKYPTRGKKKTTDHPPIHPVGVPKKSLKGDKKKIYELIVRRFLSTLTDDAVSEVIDVVFDIDGEDFETKGYKIVEPKWKDIYFYFKSKEQLLPELSEGEMVNVSRVKMVKEETKPPKRYTQGSLIAKMENLDLGTKSTRHDIINKLNRRNYITLSPLSPTPIGKAVVDALEGCRVINPEMTATLEKDMNLIAEGKKTLEDTIQESREMLEEVVEELEGDKDKIRENIQKAERKQNVIAECPRCGEDLVIRRSRKGKRFVGCSGYPDCKNTYPLPQKGGVVKTGETCKECDTPKVKILKKGRRPWVICLNPDCPGKKQNKKSGKK